MVIKLLQQSTFRQYAAIMLSPFFYFCCFRCVIVPLTGVINYVFLHLLVINCDFSRISATVFEIFTLKDRKLLIITPLPCLTPPSVGTP